MVGDKHSLFLNFTCCHGNRDFDLIAYDIWVLEYSIQVWYWDFNAQKFSLNQQNLGIFLYI